MPPKSKFGPSEAKVAAYATPFVLLALLLVLVLVNVKHSMLCEQGGESAAEAMLKRQALEKRLLTLIGPKGMGKTSLALATAQYLHDRAKFPGGVFYVQSKGATQPQELCARVLSALAEARSTGYVQEGPSYHPFPPPLPTTPSHHPFSPPLIAA